MDETDPNIIFDENGVCNYCKRYFESAKRILRPKEELTPLLNKIKEQHRGKRYDCILGISGGADSSYVAYMAKKFGLRVLLTHFNNGFNTAEGVYNVKAIVEKTGFDYEPKTCDFEEIKDLKVAYMKSGVLNIEAICDHAITASTYEVAVKHGVKCLLSGTNWVTEGILPIGWGYRQNDISNIKDIHRKHGTISLKTYPTMGLIKLGYREVIKGIKKLSMLNFVDYNREKAKQILSKDWDWKDYGKKHCECVCTRFYQQYIHPKRTGWDKRKPHFSTLICSGQMIRDEALTELKKPPYISKEQYENDREIFLTKLGFTDEEFDGFVGLPITPNSEYATDTWVYKILRFGRGTKRKLVGILKR
jgi:N-acetyl sugar amidotransferase